MCACAVASIAMLAAAIAPAEASAASPVLEFVAPGPAFPIGFEAEGGEVTAVLDGFGEEVRCAHSEGEGEVTGPRSTESDYVFTGCKTDSGGGHPCQSEGASSEEIVAEEIEADLVYLDQAKHEVAMLLNPSGGVYMNFKCGKEEVEALGSFLSPVDPVNQLVTSFTAKLERLEAEQIPREYEGSDGEGLEAIPTGVRESEPNPATTGVELAFTILTEAPLEIKAVSREEVEARQRDEEAAAKKRDEEAAAKKRQEEEAAAQKRQEEEAAAKKRREIKRAQAKRRRMHAHLHKALTQCRKLGSKHRRVRCERRVKRKYGAHKAHAKHGIHRVHRHHRYRRSRI